VIQSRRKSKPSERGDARRLKLTVNILNSSLLLRLALSIPHPATQ
jgi:hypothetical protein